MSVNPVISSLALLLCIALSGFSGSASANDKTLLKEVDPPPLQAGVPAKGTLNDYQNFLSGDFTYATERARFIAARKALSRGDRETFNRLAGGLTHYPIYRYLDYERLRSDMEFDAGDHSLKAINQFEADYGDTALTAKLIKWLQKQLVKKEKWAQFLEVSRSDSASALPCATARARFETGQLKVFDKPTRELWAEASTRGKVCKIVLETLETQSKPGIVALWTRIYDAIDRNKPSLVKALSTQLATKDRRQVQAWAAALDKPERLLKSGKLEVDNTLNRKIILDLIWRWSKEEPENAVIHWGQLRRSYQFFDDRRYELDRMLGLRGAYRRLPEASDWLNSFAARADDLELQEWRIRVALLARNWQAVLARISDLPPDEQAEDHWAYWVARAKEKLGEVEAAQQIFRELAQLQSYYGFLSADRLGQDYVLYEQPIEADPDLLALMASEPALIRAREYSHAGVAWEGRREWNATLNQYTDEELRASTVLAREWGLYDRAIYSAGRAHEKRALSYRFPFVHETDVMTAAADNNLSPALIFGVMRRESAFIADIRSGAGAVGLMQLMPATAKDVARMKGKKDWQGDLTEPATNISFGSFYLRHVLDRFDDHVLLALASYNAGPHRVVKWLPTDADMPPDLWIDTIPYSETRRYVRAVMAYSLIFQWRSTGGQPTRLLDRMKIVSKPVTDEVADNTL